MRIVIGRHLIYAPCDTGICAKKWQLVTVRTVATLLEPSRVRGAVVSSVDELSILVDERACLRSWTSPASLASTTNVCSVFVAPAIVFSACAVHANKSFRLEAVVHSR